MENRKSPGEKLGELLAGKGFYIVLLLCAALIGTSIWLMTNGSRTDVAAESKEQETVAAVTEARAPDVPAMKETEDEPLWTNTVPERPDTQTWLPASVAEEPEDAAVGLPFTPAAASAVEPLTGPETESARTGTETPWYMWPVSGPVERPFRTSSLAYDETMADWRVHPGVDLYAEPGDEVLSVTDGRVTAVYSDEMMGAVVEIDHGNGLVSVYANLSEPAEIGVGAPVRTGERIGAVGATALGESAQGSHLHFAMRENGAYVDPADYLPER